MNEPARPQVSPLPIETLATEQFIQIKHNLNFSASPRTFRQLISQNAFVDKSLLIKEILDANNDSILILRPRKWGKSLNMDMLRTFFQPDIDELGSYDLNKLSTRSRHLFDGHSPTSSGMQFSETPKPLLISQKYNDQYMKRHGQKPVAFLTFCNIDAEQYQDQHDTFNPEDVLGSIYDSISRMFEDHRYLSKFLRAIITSNSSDDDTKDYAIDDLNTFHRLRKGFDKDNRKVTEHDLRMSILFLTRLLYQHFKRRVMIIVDDYDAPINSSYGKTYSSFVTHIMNKIYMNGFVKNDYVKEVVMTGTLPLAKNILSALTDFNPYSVDDIKFAENFGFTQSEVELLTHRFYDERNDTSKLADNIKLWFNGYSIGNRMIYNPWSVLNFFERSESDPENAFQSYWINTDEEELIKDAFAKMTLSNDKEFVDLIRHHETKQQIDQSKNLADLCDADPQSKSFVSLLLHAGYLTKSDKITYRIPNIEVKQYFYTQLLPKWIEKKFNIPLNNSLIDDLADSIEDCNKYTSIIESKLLDKIDPSDKTEADFQALLGGISNYACIVALPHAKHIPHCEVPVRPKILDCMFTPIQDKSDSIIIHEYKKQNKSDGKDEQLEDALWQICANRYMRKAIELAPTNKHWKKIIIRAIVFFKNDLTGKWNMATREYVYSMSQAQQLDNAFSKADGDKLLGSAKSNIKLEAREQFLTQNNASTIDLLLNKFSCI